MLKNRVNILCFLLLISGFTHLAKAQNDGSPIQIPFFDDNGNDLQLALAGGLNTPQFNSIDLNDDGIEDLLIFDRAGDVLLPFLNGGSTNQVDYSYAPSYKVLFPPIKHWVLTRDYNDDGVMDLFTYSSVPGVAGVEVYTGSYVDGILIFEKYNFWDYDFDIIHFPSFNGIKLNLYVSDIDIPSVDDIDNDGDLDIVTFNVAGGTMEWYKNQSVELGFGKDSLRFVLAEDCWGRFYESGITESIDLSDNINECATDNIHDGIGAGPRHAGSTSLTWDLDNDGDKEIFLGDVSFSNITLLTNGGDGTTDYMTAQETNFPSADTPVDIPIFPAVFRIDINNDDLDDLLVSPNADGVSENYNVSWYYQNVGSVANPSFALQQDQLLVNEMLDLGSGAAPAFFDYNGDGLQDIVIGTFGFFQAGGTYDARLFLYENVGNALSPSFQLVDEDYLNFSNYSTRAYTPYFTDIDNDGDLDLLVGEESGKIFFGENTAGQGAAPDFPTIIPNYKNIDVGQFSTPTLGDLDQDGLPDLIVGERNGNVNFFKNIGTASAPDFAEDESISPNTQFLGSIDTRIDGEVVGFSSPKLVELPSGEVLMLCGSHSGRVFLYENLLGETYGNFTETSDKYPNIREGERTHIAFADLTGNGFYEVALGNFRGGISIFETSIAAQVVSTSESYASSTLSVFPNPSTNNFQIAAPILEGEGQMTIHDAQGKLILATPFQAEVNCSKWSAGIYFIRIENENKVWIAKVIVK